MKKQPFQKNLLVTLATSKYLILAKQLFSSVYFNAGWKGDYMLLASQVPEKHLKWFREKGILVKKCKPFYKQKGGDENEKGVNSRIGTLKFLLFTPEFKKWNNIVFLDSDIIVSASIDTLTKVRGFAAVPDSAGPLINQFVRQDDTNNALFRDLYQNYNLRKLSFNSGVLAFSSDIIKKNTFYQLKTLNRKYEKIRITSDQMAFNLLFQKKWKRLPILYNSLLLVFFRMCQKRLLKEGLETIILHFARHAELFLQTVLISECLCLSLFWLPYAPLYDRSKQSRVPSYAPRPPVYIHE